MGREITGFSSLELPETLTAPQFIISNADRTAIIHRGTVGDERSNRHTSKHHKKSLNAAIFCDEDDLLEDGSYVFRIDGALSREHPHSKTKWEFCGVRGTSDEELQFTMSEKKCTAGAKRSRCEILQAAELIDYSFSLAITYDCIFLLMCHGNIVTIKNLHRIIKERHI